MCYYVIYWHSLNGEFTVKFYTPEQAAEELGVSKRTLIRWRVEGKFVPEQKTAGGHSRYSEEQLERAKHGDYDVVETNLEGLMQ